MIDGQIEEGKQLACYKPVLELLEHVREVQEELHDQLEVQRVLAAQDRVQIARLLVLVSRLLEGQGRAADDAEVIATNLAASIERADTEDGIPGKAADAALRSEA